MSKKIGLWTLTDHVNRRIGDKTYTSLRIHVPRSEVQQIAKIRQTYGRKEPKLHFAVRYHGPNITLTLVQPQPDRPTSRPSLTQRADEIIDIMSQLGGTATWPIVREKLGLPRESSPSPFLVKQLRDRGLLTIKNPRTSTMIWKLIDREKLNGWVKPVAASKQDPDVLRT